MAEIKLLRVDTRLVHGQICTKWSKVLGINRILVVNDELCADPFMSSIYKMAAPQGVKVDIVSVDAAVEEWNSSELGDGKVLIIVKDVATVYRLYKKTFPIDTVNLGNLVAEANKIQVVNSVFLSTEEFKLLNEMNDNNVTVFAQDLPEKSKTNFTEIKKKF